MPPQTQEIIEKHSRAIRWCHWINFPLITIMIWSGILIYWANQAYFEIPAGVSRVFGIEGHLAEGMGWHFFVMWFFAVNGLIYTAYLAVSGEWRIILPGRGSIREALHVVAHDLGIRKDAPLVTGKLNGAQRFAYTGALLLGFFAIITGFAIYKPVQAGWLASLLGGYEAARFEHFLCMIFLVLFFFVHIAQVIRAGWNNMRAMITGYEVVKNVGTDSKND